MAETGDDESPDGPPPRPSPPKRKRESVVIEGRASEAGPLRAPAAVRQGARDALAAGAIGGVVGAALALAGVWLLADKPDLGPLTRRAAALEAASAAANARMSALEAAAKAAEAERRDLAQRPKASPDAEERLARLEAAERDLQGSAEALKSGL